MVFQGQPCGAVPGQSCCSWQYALQHGMRANRSGCTSARSAAAALRAGHPVTLQPPVIPLAEVATELAQCTGRALAKVESRQWLCWSGACR